MSLALSSVLKPALFDAVLSADSAHAPATSGGAGRASVAADDDIELCPRWPVPPRPWLAEAAATLPAIASQLGAQLTVGDGYCGNGSGPRPPLPHAF